MAKAIRKNLEDIAPPAVHKANIPGLNIPMDFWRGKKGADVYCLQIVFKHTSLNNGNIRGLLSLLLTD